jgi:hypothetical protein
MSGLFAVGFLGFLASQFLKMAARRYSVQVDRFLSGLRVSQPSRHIALFFDNSLKSSLLAVSD